MFILIVFLLANLSIIVNLHKQFACILQEKPRVSIKKFVKIGRPGYKGTVQNLLLRLLPVES